MKTLKLFTFICGFLSFVYSDTYSQTDLTLEQLKEYNQQKLSLELPPKWGILSFIIGGPVQSWKGYQGFERVSESEFYKIAGHDDLAIEKRKRRTIGKTLQWTGFATAVGGFLLMFADDDNDGFTNFLLTGPTVMLIGAGITAWGVSLDVKNLVPYDVASGIAGEYNLQLSISIKKQF